LHAVILPQSVQNDNFRYRAHCQRASCVSRWQRSARPCGISDLYCSLDEPGANPLREAHAVLDAAVRAAYGIGKNKGILTHLLALNHACAEKEKAGEKSTPRGLPLPAEDHAAFITTDCIKAPAL
jgi:hypothetical protein